MAIRHQPQAGIWPSRLMTALGILWLGLFPLWQDGSYTRITRAKWLAMLVLTGITVLTVAMTILVLLCQGKKRMIRLHPAQLLCLGYLGWVGLSAWQGSLASQLNAQEQLVVLWGAVRYEGLITQLCYGAIFLFLSLLRIRLRPVLEAASAALLVCAGVIGLQYAGLNPCGLFPEGLGVNSHMEFQGTIGNIDVLSAWLCLTVPLLLGGWIMKQCSVHGLLAGLAGVMIQLCIGVQSGLIALAFMLALLLGLMLAKPAHRSRGFAVFSGVFFLLTLYATMVMPWETELQTVQFFVHFRVWMLLPLMLGILCALLAWHTSRTPGTALSPRKILTAAGIGMLLMLAAICFLPMPEGTGLWELKELLCGRPHDSYGSERLGVWRLTLEMSRDHLLFGSGPDTFLYTLQFHMTSTGQSLLQTFDNPHNMLLAILSNNGAPALLLFLALIVSVSLPALKRGKCLALGMGLWGYLVQGMFTFSICLTAPMFWAMMGMLISLDSSPVYDHERNDNA